MMHLDELKHALRADCIASGVKTKTHYISLPSQHVWMTPQQKMCAVEYASPINALAAAMWMYAGCPNPKKFGFLLPPTNGDISIRYSMLNVDQIETSMLLENRPKFGSTVVLRGSTSFSVIDVKDVCPMIDVTLMYIKASIAVPVITITGGTVDVVIHRVLPMLSFYLTELRHRYGVEIHDNAVIVQCKFLRQRVDEIEDEDAWVYPVSRDPIRHRFRVDDCFTNHDPMFDELNIIDLNEVFDNPTTIGGSSVARRVIKPIVLAALLEHQGEDITDLINQIQEGPTKEACATLYHLPI